MDASDVSRGETSWKNVWALKCARFIKWHIDEEMLDRVILNTRKCFYDALDDHSLVGYSIDYVSMMEIQVNLKMKRLW